MLQINYPSMTNAFATGADTGMKLGSMIRANREDNAKPNIPIPDPGQKPQIDISVVMQNEQKDLETYGKYYEKTKKLEPEQKQWIFDDLKKSGAITTPIGQTVFNGNIKPEEISDVFNNIRNKKPTAQADIDLLITNAGGKDSLAGKAISNKIAEAQQMQIKSDDDWAIKAMDTLTVIDDVHKNLKNFTNKRGEASDSVIKALSSENYLVNQLYMMGGEYREWAKQYVDQRTQKEGLTFSQRMALKGAGSPNIKVLYDQKGRMAILRNGMVDKTQSNPDFTLVGAKPLTNIQFAQQIMDGAVQPTTDIYDISNEPGSMTPSEKKVAAQKPASSEKNKLKPLKQSDVDRFLKENGNDPVKATKASKDAKYDTSVIVK